MELEKVLFKILLSENFIATLYNEVAGDANLDFIGLISDWNQPIAKEHRPNTYQNTKKKYQPSRNIPL
ncbi:MAG: hypothetical protein HDR88_00725 [Bacteroides sp.]|nr:hypothetical protein [Bacteroides sp.]